MSTLKCDGCKKDVDNREVTFWYEESLELCTSCNYEKEQKLDNLTDEE